MGSRGKRFEQRFLLAWEAEGEFFTDDGTVVLGPRCAYCGDRAERQEHVALNSWVERAILAGRGGVEGFWTWVVPACNQCNGIASDNLFRSPEEKREFIQERLRGKFPDAFVEEPWSEDEYEDLGPGLRQFVMAKQAANEVARERVSYRGPLPDLLGSTTLHLAVNEVLDVRLQGSSHERV